MIPKPSETIDDLRVLLLEKLLSVGLPLICSADDLDGITDWRSIKSGLTNMLIAGGATDIRIKRLESCRSRSGLTRVVSLETELRPDAAIYCALEVRSAALPVSIIDEMESTDLPMGSLLGQAGIIVSYELIETFCVHRLPGGALWGHGRTVLLLNDKVEVCARSVEVLNGPAQGIFSLKHNGATDSR
jgi:hypothetical protein